ncbi:MAG TPA: hypothetical protein VGI39_20960, partial [Polyangiaceae bacterium]
MRTRDAYLWLGFAAAGLSALAAYGCSRTSEEAVDENEGRSQAADDAVCALNKVAWDSTVTPDQRACAGPWQYNRLVTPCYAQHDDDPACPPALDANGNYEYENYPDLCRDYQSCYVPTWGTKTVDQAKFLVHWKDGMDPAPTNSAYPVYTLDGSQYPDPPCYSTSPSCGRSNALAQLVQGVCGTEENQWFNTQMSSTAADVKQL